MSLRVGLNGAGRIGRALVRLLRQDERVQLVALNDVAPLDAIANLVRHDSIHGAFPGTIEVADARLIVDGRALPVSHEAAPPNAPWAAHGVDVVVEATGRFARGEAARSHLDAGAARVLVSAVCPGADETIVLGVHDGRWPAGSRVVATASCTTHAAALPLMLIDGWYGAEAVEMETVHCTTGSQPTIDLPHKDPRRARSALLSIIPTTTSASRGLADVFPGLRDRLTCLAIRVPIATVSLVQLVVQTRRPVDELPVLAERFRGASAEPGLAGRLGVSEEQLVSIDFRGDPRSSIVDIPLLARPGAHLVRVAAWYDNEWGYASRLAELLRLWADEPGATAGTP